MAAPLAREAEGLAAAAASQFEEQPFSASDASAMEEVMSLPPAAAAILYRTWDSVRTGVQEVQAGRPLTRGGTASAGGAAAAAATASRKLLGSAAGRPGSSTLGRPPPGSSGGTMRAGLLSSATSRRPMTAQARARAGTPALREQTVSGLLVAFSSKREPSSTVVSTVASAAGTAGTSSGFEGLPPITFPLTTGVRAMLRRMGSGTSNAAADTSLADGVNQTRNSSGEGERTPAARRYVFPGQPCSTDDDERSAREDVVPDLDLDLVGGCWRRKGRSSSTP